MTKGWAIYPTQKEGQENAFDWIISSAKLFNLDVDIMFAEDFTIVDNSIKYRDETCALPSFVLMRTYDDKLSIHLESLSVLVINSSYSMHVSRDKYLTYNKLKELNIPTPLTLLNNRSYIDNCLRLGSPFVLKGIRGSKGEDIFLIQCEDEFISLQNNYSEYITQKYISTSKGRDIRVWVVGDKVAGCVLRENTSSFKSNLFQGGTATPFHINPNIEKLALQACKALGLELCGVDILFDADSYKICEMNGNAGFRSFSKEGDQSVDIPKEIFAYISSKL